MRTLSRVRRQRKALLSGLARALILHGKIKTTEAKAKELRPAIEKLITRARTNTLASRRMILAQFANEREVADKLIAEIAPRYKDRPGGYTRITKLPPRASDAAKEAIIEFV